MTNANNFCWCLGHVISIILKVYFYHYLNRSIYKEKKYTGSRYLIVRTSILYFVFDGLIFDIKTFFLNTSSKHQKFVWKKKMTWCWYLMIRILTLYFVLFINFCLWSQHHNIFCVNEYFAYLSKKTFFHVEFIFLIIFNIMKSKQ